jgi:hypothetical protein
MSLADQLAEQRLIQRRRGQFLPAEANTQACWNTLVDLALARLTGKAISITSACIASGAPPTTALRHLAILEAERLAERRPDPLDSRRFYLGITQEGFELVEAILSARCDHVALTLTERAA